MTVSAIVLDVVLVAVAVVGLGAGAAQFVSGASRLARRVGLSGLVVGLTVVAFGTSAPEFAVTIDAALTSKPNISVGNVVGSNIVNLGFILGGVALVQTLPTSPTLVRRDGTALIATTALVLAFLRDLRLTRVEGASLLALLVVYLAVLLRTRRRQGTVPGEAAVERPWRDALRAVGGLAVVVGGAHVLVISAADLARVAGVSEWVIGVTVVSVGTSLPELATSIAAARRGRAGLSAGNLVGSCLFNYLGVLGAAAVIRPLPVVSTAIETTLWLLGTAIVVTVMFWSRSLLSRAEGAVLVLLNVGNWVFDFVG